MATRLKPSRINVDNTPRVGDGASYQNDNDFHWSEGGGDMSYEDFEWVTLTGNSLVIENISNNVTPTGDFTVSAGTLRPGIEYVLRVNTGNTPYTMTLGTGVTNPNGYSTELTPNKVNQFKFIATSDSQLELEGVDTSEYLTGLTILSYGNSTWNDFITAYQKKSIVYCRASSESNPATGSQNRLAFMAYVNNATTPTEVEFQYYRSRSSHSTAQNQQDEVYVYKLTNTSGGTWTVEVRDTAARITTGTGLTNSYTTSSGITTMTIVNDGVLTVNGANGTVTVNDIKQSATAPDNPTAGTAWYDTTNGVLKVYNGTAWDNIATGGAISDTAYGSAWDGQTTTAPSQNAVYDKINAMDTTIASKANDSDVVKLSGNQTINGTKTFGTSPVVPSKTTAAKNTGTAIATEAQVYKKQDKLVSGTNIKKINNNSLLGSGDLTLNDVKVSSTAPSSPTEGMVWYDTTNDQLKVYDGTNWNVTGKEYHAGEGIEIGTVQDYSAMRGPCPTGYHVPNKSEWTAVYNLWKALGGGSKDGINFGKALKLPYNGFRNSPSGITQQNASGYYWESSGNGRDGYYLLFYDTAIGTTVQLNKKNGLGIRAFKNMPVIPTSSWTKLYGTSIEAGGIFWSSLLGLISLSRDGTTWITIADKNLGATTVWNSGDTLSEANCGKYYQWGNNYGFPRTGTISNTSTDQIDASDYGPGNYYYSETFINYDGNWDSSNNNDLWGGVTGVVTLDNAITNTGVLSVNGQTGDVTIDSGITKIFTLASNSDLTTAQAAYDWYLGGGYVILKISGQNAVYIPQYAGSTSMKFARTYGYGNVSIGDWLRNEYVLFSLSSGSVTSISVFGNVINISSSAPTSGTNNGVITLVI